jgi:hypothetical protein
MIWILAVVHPILGGARVENGATARGARGDRRNGSSLRPIARCGEAGGTGLGGLLSHCGTRAKYS